MKKSRLITVFALGGLFLSGHSLTSVQAQTKQPGYLIVETEVLEPAAYQDYVKQVVPLIGKMGGQFLVRGSTSVPVSPAGSAPRRVSLIKFESKEKAQSFEDSPELAKLRPAREKSAKTHSYIVEGTPP